MIGQSQPLICESCYGIFPVEGNVLYDTIMSWSRKGLFHQHLWSYGTTVLNKYVYYYYYYQNGTAAEWRVLGCASLVTKLFLTAAHTLLLTTNTIMLIIIIDGFSMPAFSKGTDAAIIQNQENPKTSFRLFKTDNWFWTQHIRFCNP